MNRLFCTIVLIVLHDAALYASESSKVHVSALSILNEAIRANLEFIDILEPDAKPIRFTTSGPPAVVPQSLYMVRVKAKGFANRTFIANITDNETYLRIGLNVSRLSDEDKRSLSGQVEFDTPTVQGTWVRLVPILNQQETVEVPLSPEGSFFFGELAGGEYALLILDGPRLLHAEQVSCFGQSSVRIRVNRGDRGK
jgi:hypothetical protein